MKITIEIGGNDYTFEMNRWAYKKLLADEEYAKMQNEITKKLKEKKGDTKKAVKEVQEEMFDEDISAFMLRNMVMEEQIFYYSLLTNYPDMTIDNASALLDKAIKQYGYMEVSGLATKLMENFTQRDVETKKKMVMRIG